MTEKELLESIWNTRKAINALMDLKAFAEHKTQLEQAKSVLNFMQELFPMLKAPNGYSNMLSSTDENGKTEFFI